VILVGIDDTDIPNSRGTNQLARRIVSEISEQWQCIRIVRHQLLFDPRVPYTSKNGSASIALELRSELSRSEVDAAEKKAATNSLLPTFRRLMMDDFIPGSDPGLCLLTETCPPEVINWGHRCQQEIVSTAEAYAIAEQTGLHLESLGGTEDGVIGALAAIGLATTENDGRIVQLGEWPEELSGPQSVAQINQRGVIVREVQSNSEITQGTIDVGKKLRPNLRDGSAVLFVERETQCASENYRAIKKP